MKRILSVVFATILSLTLALSFTGCGIQVGDSSTTSDSNATSSVIDNPGAKYELQVNVLSGNSEYSTMMTWAQGYMEKNSDVKIAVNNTMSSMADLGNWKLNNELPDIAWTAGDQHAPYSANGYFVDLRTFTVGEDANFFDDFYSALIETTHYSSTDEGIWFMPRDYNQLTCFLNVDLLTEAGITIPSASWTWADLENICVQWREYNSRTKYYPIEMDFDWNPQSVTFLANSDASVYDNNGKLTIDSENTASCMTTLNDWIVNKKYISTSTGGFNGLYSPIMVSVRPNLPLAASSVESVIALPYPSTTTASNGSGYVGVGCSGYGITTGCSEVNKPIAWDFLKYCMSEEGYEKVGSTGTIVPALESLKNKGSWTEYKNSNGVVVSSAAFTQSVAEPISVNFCNNLQALNQATARTAFMSFFEAVGGSGYNYQTSLAEFISKLNALS